MRVYPHFKICNCRSAGECTHNAFVEQEALERLVKFFANELRQTLLRNLYKKNKSGWDDPSWSVEDMKAQLIAHVEKGQPIGVAAFAAFWWNRLDEPVPTPAQPKNVVDALDGDHAL
jgi:hypothetical protein